MKVHLMFRDRNFQPSAELTPEWEDVRRDLGMESILSAMAGEDRVIAAAAAGALFSPLQDCAQIEYRQAVLRDALAQPELFRQIYDLCRETEERRRSAWYMLSSHHLSVTFRSAAELLLLYAGALRKLRDLAADGGDRFHSEVRGK